MLDKIGKLGQGSDFFMDPVFVKDGEWYFYDETWADTFGPFRTEEEARHNLELYCETL